MLMEQIPDCNKILQGHRPRAVNSGMVLLSDTEYSKHIRAISNQQL